MRNGIREIADVMLTAGHRCSLGVAAITLGLLVAGCASVRVTETPRSRLEQRLFLQALQRAVSQIDVEGLTGKRVFLELIALAQTDELDDGEFVSEYLGVWLLQQGVVVVRDPKDAELRLKVFANVLAVDHSGFLIGTPAFSLLGMPIPSISIYHLESTQGHVQLKPHVIDEQKGELITELPERAAESRFDEHTAMIVIGWTTTDLEESADDGGP